MNSKHLLLRLASQLPASSEERRALIRVLYADDEEAPKKGKGGKGGVSGLMLQFFEEMDGKLVMNPDTKNLVSVKTLSGKPKGSKARAMFEREFNRWKDEKKRKEEKAKAPPKAEETKPEWKTSKEREEFAESLNPLRDQWTASQKKAIRTYTGESYRNINSALRKVEGVKLAEENEEVVKELDDLFASKAAVLPSAAKSLRKLGNKHPLVDLLRSGNLKKGMIVEDGGFQSTSLDKDLKWGSEVSLHIEVPKGTRAIYLGPPPKDSGFSEYPEEEELLLDRGTQLEIVDFDPNDGDGVIRVRVKPKEK